jgi:hypothetical protein
MAKIISTNTYVISINGSNLRQLYFPQKRKYVKKNTVKRKYVKKNTVKRKYVKKNTVKRNTVKNKSETTTIHRCITKRSWYVRYRSGRKTWKRSQYFKYKKDAIEYYRTIVQDVIKPKSEEHKSHFIKTKRTIIPNWIKDDVASGQSWKCNICEESLTSSRITDHIIPLQFGGTNCVSNYQSICHKCNRFKTYEFDNKIIKPLISKNRRLKPKYFIALEKKEYKKYFR